MQQQGYSSEEHGGGFDARLFDGATAIFAKNMAADRSGSSIRAERYLREGRSDGGGFGPEFDAERGIFERKRSRRHQIQGRIIRCGRNDIQSKAMPGGQARSKA